MSNDRVKLVREISRSGIATVWEGWDNSLDRKVLVKSIHPQFARDADLRIRFEREARAIARLSHPNVVQIYDIQSGEDSLSLLLEYVDGETLGSLLKRRGVLPYGVALRVMTDILSGLEEAHKNGIIHRDLKPDNILIAQTGAVKITDFGLASLRDLPAVTQEGMVVGTPTYMSPEQALGGETGPQTDLFTCGAMFFEMLTGNRLIKGDNLGEAFQNVMKYRTPDLGEWSDFIPPHAIKVLEQLIDRDPSARQESAHATREALISDPPEPVADLTRLTAFLSGNERTEPAIPVEHRKKPHPMILWLVLSAVVLAVVLIGLFSMAKKEQPPVTKSETKQPVDTVVTPPVEIPDTTHIRDTLSRTVDTSQAPPKPKPRDTLAVTPPIEEKPVPTGPSFVTITSTPWARVFFNDSLLGTTPLVTPIKLPSGMGSFLFLNDQIGLPVTRQVQLPAADTIEINADLQESVGRLRVASVRPWADVFVDGQMKFRTPSTQVVYLPLGSHTLELRHPNYPTYHKELIFENGDPVYEVHVDLTQL
ncbi:MAG: serine/threonine protein kinase [Calditrichaeota bacterium]|nr:serine/threonine protein kinase [Calditrichota bacterium]MCB9367900.1 serine/threonine protein kinase [Calditrichota bacterium]